MLTLTQGVFAQTNNNFAKPGALADTTNAAVQMLPLVVSLADHAPAARVSAGVNSNGLAAFAASSTVQHVYRLGDPANDAPAATLSFPLSNTENTALPASTIAPGWANGIAAGLNGGDSSEREAHLRWVQSH